MPQDATRRVTVVGVLPGLQLVTDINDIVAAIEGGNKGSTAPPAPELGLTWIDDSAAPLWRVKRYLGSSVWVTEREIDTTTGKAILPVTLGGTGVETLPALQSLIGSGDTIGSVKPWLLAAPPTGWLSLNGETMGSAASAADKKDDAYEALFIALYTNWTDQWAPVIGGRGASAQGDWDANKAITLPDFRGRTPIGFGTGLDLSNRVLGEAGGSEDAIVAAHSHGAGTLTTTTAGAHDHDAPVGNNSGGDGAISPNSSAQDDPLKTSTDGAHQHGVTGNTASAGSSGADKNMPPYIAINWIAFYGG